MSLPIPTLRPSASTIEQLSNHWIMNFMGSGNAWFYVPTKNEEKHLGYDAFMQGWKTMVIQYKRISGTAKKGVSATVNQLQLNTLRLRFPKLGTPYVFVAFAEYRRYADLSSLFGRGAGVTFGTKVCFVDVHTIPPHVTKLSLIGSVVGTSTIVVGKSKKKLNQIAPYGNGSL